MRDVGRALEDLAEIHASLAAREIYRGWRSLPVALSGLVGIAAAAVLTIYQPAESPTIEASTAFLGTWFSVAAAAGLTGCAEILWHYARASRVLDRKRTEVVMRQLLPALAVGAVISLAIVRVNPANVSLVPGIWALAFALGVFAARPCLPPVSVWAAGYYALAGLALLAHAMTTIPALPAPWTVGLTFGVGQLFGAALIYVALERGLGRTHDDEEA